MFDRMVDRIGAAAANSSVVTGTGTSASAQAAAALMKFSGFSATAQKAVPVKEPEKLTEEPVREEDGVLGLEAAEQMLKWHAEGIGRCVVLSPTNDVLVIYFDLIVAYFISSPHFST